MPVRSILFCLAALLALPAAAQQTPEDAYARLHGAVLSKSVKDVMRYSTNARRAEVAANPSAESELAALATNLPPAYIVTDKTLAPDGNSARLRVRGQHGSSAEGAPMLGMVDLRREGGAWRVEQWVWSADRSAAGQTAQATRPEAKAAAAPESAPAPQDQAKPAAPAGDAALGRSAKAEPCVIKPVMSDADLRNCGARVPVTYEKPR